MLTDSQMQRLAEMCGWELFELVEVTDEKDPFSHYFDGCYVEKDQGAFMSTDGVLTPAGYFTVIKVLELYVSITAEGTWLAGSYREDADENDEGEGDTLEAAIDAALEEILWTQTQYS